MKYTVTQAAKYAKKEKITIHHAIRRKILIAEKLDPSVQNSPFLIDEKDLKNYVENHTITGPKKKRCEPCNHEKKNCLTCKRQLCLNDFYMQNSSTARKRPSCKDCDLEKIKKQRDKL
jgi:hypothetical protein